MNTGNYRIIRTTLTTNLYGFHQLIDSIQGMVCGYYVHAIESPFLATEIPTTEDMDHTLRLVKSILNDVNEMTEAWGFQK